MFDLSSISESGKYGQISDLNRCCNSASERMHPATEGESGGKLSAARENADVYTVRNGKAIEMRAFADQQEALRWAGVELNR